MFCEHCGYQLDDNVQFCVNCGNRVLGAGADQIMSTQSDAGATVALQPDAETTAVLQSDAAATAVLQPNVANAASSMPGDAPQAPAAYNPYGVNPQQQTTPLNQADPAQHMPYQRSDEGATAVMPSAPTSDTFSGSPVAPTGAAYDPNNAYNGYAQQNASPILQDGPKKKSKAPIIIVVIIAAVVVVGALVASAVNSAVNDAADKVSDLQSLIDDFSEDSELGEDVLDELADELDADKSADASASGSDTDAGTDTGTGSTASAAGSSKTLEDYLKENPEDWERVKEEIAAMENDEFDTALDVKGNTINQVMTFNTAFSDDEIALVKSLLKDDDMTSPLKSVIEGIESASGLEGVVWHVEFRDADDRLIWESDIKA